MINTDKSNDNFKFPDHGMLKNGLSVELGDVRKGSIHCGHYVNGVGFG
jgi:hypothetical protein